MRVGAISIVHKKSNGRGKMGAPGTSTFQTKRRSVITQTPHFKQILPIYHQKGAVFKGFNGVNSIFNP